MFKIYFLMFCLILTLPLHASTVSYNGYTLDTNTNIVVGNSLEWLQWDETAGLSITSALAIYQAQGWRLATNNDMATLFNSFDFGLAFDTDESTNQLQRTPWDSAEESEFTKFIDLFGDTYAVSTLNCATCLPSDTYVSARAYFGIFDNSNDLINLAGVSDDYIAGSAQFEAEAFMSGEFYFITDSFTSHGVALVRATSQVPLPAAGLLFLSGFISLLLINRNTRLHNRSI